MRSSWIILGFLVLAMNTPPEATAAPVSGRPRIYQLFLRQFSNTNETRTLNGTLAENGVGKCGDLDAPALKSLREEESSASHAQEITPQARSQTSFAPLGKFCTPS